MDRFEEKAREIAHRLSPRCTGGQPWDYEAGSRWHSKTCDTLTKEIKSAMEWASRQTFDEMVRKEQDLIECDRNA